MQWKKFPSDGPYDEITMGGMFTILKVRESPASYDEDPGWYEPPPGTLASAANDESIRTNNIAADASTAPRAPAAAMRPWQQAPSTARPSGGADGHTGHHGH